MVRRHVFVLALLVGIAALLPVGTASSDVCPCDNPEVETIIGNLEYSVRDYRASPPVFRCRAMCDMAHHFFSAAGYDCEILSVVWDGTRHAVIGGECCPDGCFYEATQKRFLTQSGYDTSDARRVERPDVVWMSWYDWRWTRGDINDDGGIDIFDFVLFAAAYGTAVPEEGYAMLADMDLDGEIGLIDFVSFVQVYGLKRGSNEG